MNTAPLSTSYRVTPDNVVTLFRSWIGSSETQAGAMALVKKHCKLTTLDWYGPPAVNPIIREITCPLRMDGCRVFLRADGTENIYDPRQQTIPMWEKATGLPMPLFPPSPDLGARPAAERRTNFERDAATQPGPVDSAALGRLFRDVRCGAGLSLQDLVGLSGVSRTCILNLEANKGQTPTLQTLSMIAGALNVRLSDLIQQSES